MRDFRSDTGADLAQHALTVRDLRHDVRGTCLLDIPSLTLPATGATLVMGPNGAGKSLMLRVLHGLLTPSTPGCVEVARTLARQAMVFQKPVLLRRSVAGNIDYALKTCGVARRDRPRRRGELLALGGLTALADRAARSLSGGEQQRLALVRALATEPDLLFLDEPTASLDPAATKAIEDLLQGALLGGTKVVMVSHDPGQAKRLATDIVFLNRGRVVEHSPAGAFFDAPGSAEARAYLNGGLLV
ncbi:MAG: ATP-binding cassette domain-containing protein [Pseudomonadota bacterium]